MSVLSSFSNETESLQALDLVPQTGFSRSLACLFEGSLKSFFCVFQRKFFNSTFPLVNSLFLLILGLFHQVYLES